MCQYNNAAIGKLFHPVFKHMPCQRPLLEYGCAVWGPISSQDINTLENVHRYFTNKIRGCTFLPYNLR